MQLSIVIVNYNVKYFLEQCLSSVIRATKNIDSEIYVVDNNSVDGSCQMVKNKFPNVFLIENKENVGFSKANNQAIKISKGKYILLLNPDTVVEENTFEKCIEFMDTHPESGALGVQMIDGKGKFLPESKRSLPTPRVAYFKLFGLSSIFPKSKVFGKYHLGYLDKDKTHQIEILPGAFMFIRTETLKITGLLDEDFFMYGEDIDLSYRIIKAGYKNYYFPETRIIHYKGESTKKGSINYVLVFYNAMIIFAKKHFPAKNAKLFSFLINFAIYFRAAISLFKRFAKRITLPLLDAAVIFLGYYFIEPVWENFVFSGTTGYPDLYLRIVVPAYIFTWLLFIYFSGGYEKPVKILKILKGIGLGTLIILVIYALLPLEYRFSRALILIGAVWAGLSAIIIRLFIHLLNFPDYRLALKDKKRLIIVASPPETKRIVELLKQTNLKHEVFGFVSPDNQNNYKGNYIGNIEQIFEIVKINKIDELIFSAKDLPAETIIENMLRLASLNPDFKIAPQESFSIIGSNSINTAGELYVADFNLINLESNKRYKRLVDLGVAGFFLLFSPIFMFFFRKPHRFFMNVVAVLTGFSSWVGYYKEGDVNIHNLPKIKNGILNPGDSFSRENLLPKALERLNFIYAKDYKIINDLSIILKGFKQLDR